MSLVLAKQSSFYQLLCGWTHWALQVTAMPLTWCPIVCPLQQLLIG